jgi:hypothetical protein
MASSSHLKQGEKGTISARMSTSMKSGPIEETIEVVSNDPKRSKVILTLEATVLESLVPPSKKDILTPSRPE